MQFRSVAPLREIPLYYQIFVYILFTTDICTLQPVTGHCRTRFSRYFYNTTSGNCEVFSYGGCGGNQNQFETSAECAATCSRNCKYQIIHIMPQS